MTTDAEAKEGAEVKTVGKKALHGDTAADLDVDPRTVFVRNLAFTIDDAKVCDIQIHSILVAHIAFAPIKLLTLPMSAPIHFL